MSGTTVTAINRGAHVHDWQSQGNWSSGPMRTQQAYAYRFTTPGTYSFVCSYHTRMGMTGTITVR